MPLLQHFRERSGIASSDIIEATLFVVVLSAAVLSISRGRKWKMLAIILGLPAVILWAIPPSFAGESLRIVRHLYAAGFLVYAISSILRLIFTSKQVTLNLLCASLCVYLLLGIAWGLAYSAASVVNVNSFKFTPGAGDMPTAMRMDGRHSIEAIYFSFTTMTTLGYGDIVPTTPITRMLAVLEAIVGQLYLAVLVARLVGLHIVTSEHDKLNEPLK